MTKMGVLRRLLLPCFSPSAAGASSSSTAATITTKKRLSTSLRDDLPQNDTLQDPNDKKDSQDSDSDSLNPSSAAIAQPRASKSMVIGTIFGSRRGHVWFCVQHDRRAAKPLLLIELPIPTHQLVAEMRFGLVRIALECARPDIGPCSLRSVPVWTLSINGRKQLGFAARRRAGDRVRSMLRTMQSTTVGAGVIPAAPSHDGDEAEEEVMYMRANYEHVVGNADSESFHLVNPDQCPSQELSVFLLRSSRNGGVSR